MEFVGWILGVFLTIMIGKRLMRRAPSFVDVLAIVSCIAFVMISTLFVATIIGVVAGVAALAWIVSSA